MNFHTRCGFLGTAAMVVALSQTGNTQAPQADWPQWRGAARDGIVAQSQLPASWPETFKAKWTVEVGEGYSSPVATGGRIFVHSRRDPQEVVTAIDADDQAKAGPPITRPCCSPADTWCISQASAS